MMKMIDDEAADRKKNSKSGDAKKCLKNLLRSGIPGIEGMFAGPPEPPKVNKKTGKLEVKKQKGFHKMTEGSKGEGRKKTALSVHFIIMSLSVWESRCGGFKGGLEAWLAPLMTIKGPC